MRVERSDTVKLELKVTVPSLASQNYYHAVSCGEVTSCNALVSIADYMCGQNIKNI